MSEYRKLGAARLLRDNSYAGKEGATLEVVEYPNEGWFGPALEDGSDSHGDFWAYPSAVTTVEHTLPIVCIGKPGRDFEWVSVDDAEPVTIPATSEHDGIPFVLTHAERSQAALYRAQLIRMVNERNARDRANKDEGGQS